ncbi:MAG: 30S ribosomal protein S16 [Chloroflexia bacterium]
MLKIRLRRIGAIRQPHYRIVVADARAPRDGAFLEILGHYNPRTDPATIQVDVAKYEDWKHKGAQPTEAVERLVRQFNRAARKAAAAEETSSASRRTRTASGKGISRPTAVAEAPAEAPAPPEGPIAAIPTAEAVAEETALNSTDEPVLEAVTETPAGAAEGSTDTDTAV